MSRLRAVAGFGGRRLKLVMIFDSPLFPLLLFSLVLGFGLLFWTPRVGPFRWKGSLLALSHPFIALGLFYSFAIHMNWTLGGWPKQYGDDGFPPLLLMHEEAVDWGVMSLFFGSIFVVPIVAFSCAFIDRWRGALRYLGVYSLSFSVTYFAMQMAPKAFLEWWWD
jgi:hypothetical protein